MSTTDIGKIELLLTQLTAALGERCPARQKQINENAKDINKAFEQLKAVRETMARWSMLSSLATAVLTAGVVKFLVR